MSEAVLWDSSGPIGVKNPDKWEHKSRMSFQHQINIHELVVQYMVCWYQMEMGQSRSVPRTILLIYDTIINIFVHITICKTFEMTFE